MATEPWLRGPISGVHPLLAPILYAFQQAREDLEEEEQNRRLAVRLTLIADGDKALSDLVMVWQQAKQSGDGGPPWNEAKQHLLELLDTTVQLIQS